VVGNAVACVELQAAGDKHLKKRAEKSRDYSTGELALRAQECRHERRGASLPAAQFTRER